MIGHRWLLELEKHKVKFIKVGKEPGKDESSGDEQESDTEPMIILYGMKRTVQR